MQPLAGHPSRILKTSRSVSSCLGRSSNDKASLQYQWSCSCSMTVRFCAEIETTLQQLLRNLTAENVKTFFDWLKNMHSKSIKTASAVKDY